ncbi:hypothetical protein L2E82_22742 [Cichorium intybus]|uniref:Uncharacterized protein n=1 Tax=Cichorium intybus TaxID=13427 RepID=A0ACB9DYT3_CICIN|nr:hypothetical protein L2E82_22742 [Cichorium intybus]
MADRRQWTQEEEDALITILQDIVVIGGRGDNGSFRPGTYDQVVLKLREKIIGINITAKHVQNKIKRLKDKFSAAYDMQNTSGFGWDDARKCVIVDSPEILEEYLKKHPNKNYVANKPFLAYERLANVFGKDRATGSMAESAADANEEGEYDMIAPRTLHLQIFVKVPPMVIRHIYKQFFHVWFKACKILHTVPHETFCNL